MILLDSVLGCALHSTVPQDKGYTSVEIKVNYLEAVWVPAGAGRGSRTPIPQHVKTDVWQRDHGRCVECHATEYLEFDHVIPRSKGGADTVRNLQLLCRRCNQRKSDRI